MRLGDRFRDRKMLDVALIQYNKGLKIEPNNHVILNKIAKIYLVQKKFSLAEENFKKSLISSPNYGPTYTNLGNLYFLKEKYEEALNNYIQSNQINPFNPLIHKNMAAIYEKIGQEEKAKKEFEIFSILLN